MSLPPVPLSDTCGRLCIYMWMNTLRQNNCPQPVRKGHFFNESQRTEPLSRPNLSPSEGI